MLRSKPNVVIDADGVLYDRTGHVLQYLRDRWNIIIPRSKVLTQDLARLTGRPDVDKGILDECILNPHFYHTMPLLPGVIEAIKLLNQFVILNVVSNRPKHCLRTTKERVTTDFMTSDPIRYGCFNEVHTVRGKWKEAKRLRAVWAFEDNYELVEEYAKHQIPCYYITELPMTLLRPTRYIKKAGSLLEAAQLICGVGASH